MFEEFWEKQRKIEPTEPKYISICKILQGSGEDRDVIEEIFKSHMEVGIDYDEDETKEMVDYLYEIAKDIND